MEEYLKNKYGNNYKDIFAKNATSAAHAEEFSSLFDTDYNGNVKYPEYIGGLYINDDEELVIQIVDNKDFELSDAYSANGDSGGVVFEYPTVISGPNGGYKTSGIIKGHAASTNGMMFSKASSVNSALSLTRY